RFHHHHAHRMVCLAVGTHRENVLDAALSAASKGALTLVVILVDITALRGVRLQSPHRRSAGERCRFLAEKIAQHCRYFRVKMLSDGTSRALDNPSHREHIEVGIKL